MAVRATSTRFFISHSVPRAHEYPAPMRRPVVKVLMAVPLRASLIRTVTVYSVWLILVTTPIMS